MPDRIAVYPDRVEGSVDQPHGRLPTIFTMHFRDVTSAFAGGNRGGKEKFWVPGGVVAEDHFDDPSNVGAMGMVHGPPVPPGCAKSFVLFEENVPRVREAFDRFAKPPPAPVSFVSSGKSPTPRVAGA
jgi:hypothetical protein